MDRRTFLGAASLGLMGTAGVATYNVRHAGAFASHNAAPGARLKARPSDPRKVARTLATGVTRHSIGDTEVVAYLPPSAQERDRVPLMVFLHGANRTVDAFVERFRPFADAHGVMLLLPFAVVGTWDAIRYYFGPDVAAIDEALRWTFARVPVDPARILLSGFSDGATYTLGLGRANGDLFSRLVAFSPGFLIPVDAVKRPPILISHGRADRVLPFENARDRIVPELVKGGYTVDFRPFDGPHMVPMELAEAEIRQLGASA